ncbi:diacylglycerol kinase 4-like isoform X3 [Humulus lupulus]|uniref:diacylglycerol kinase 4-like isoform X3 n=1 Tax=Humulus lupulus TaxID=3486 RepID=UPI002B414B70|nr:diacylglycerol kinase 4-like isoform X3 [Humulus lupulus]
MQGLEIEGELPEKKTCYEGVFYNYFSIGMDAQVAYDFHHLRNEKPYLAQGPISNKGTNKYFKAACQKGQLLRMGANYCSVKCKSYCCFKSS